MAKGGNTSGDLSIGMSGWRGGFYSKGLAPKERVPSRGSIFLSVKINRTHYSQQDQNASLVIFRNSGRFRVRHQRPMLHHLYAEAEKRGSPDFAA